MIWPHELAAVRARISAMGEFDPATAYITRSGYVTARKAATCNVYRIVGHAAWMLKSSVDLDDDILDCLNVQEMHEAWRRYRHLLTPSQRDELMEWLDREFTIPIDDDEYMAHRETWMREWSAWREDVRATVR